MVTVIGKDYSHCYYYKILGYINYTFARQMFLYIFHAHFQEIKSSDLLEGRTWHAVYYIGLTKYRTILKKEKLLHLIRLIFIFFEVMKITFFL
jgi:hypothetical protein